jgi:hypothetical protein
MIVRYPTYCRYYLVVANRQVEATIGKPFSTLYIYPKPLNATMTRWSITASYKVVTQFSSRYS